MSMAPRVRMSLAERFLNWHVRYTTLYFRRDRFERAAEDKGVIEVMKRHFAQCLRSSIRLIARWTGSAPRSSASRASAMMSGGCTRRVSPTLEGTRERSRKARQWRPFENSERSATGCGRRWTRSHTETTSADRTTAQAATLFAR